MKKLNITKEQFNRSRYFKNKYGDLEYVSESGKVFKTSKGKLLKFRESIIKDIAPGIQDWGATIYVEPLGAELDWKDVFDFVKADCHLYPLLEEDIGVEPYEVPSNKQIRKWIKTKPENFVNYLKEFGYYDYANGPDEDDLENESTKKFGKKFNESDDEIGDAVRDAYDKYRACRTEPKVCHAIKINDDGTEKKIGIWMDRGNSIGGIVKAIRDGRLRKVLQFSESSKPKFVKESGEELYAEINIWPDDLRMWDDLLNQEIDYDEYDFDEESTVFQETARFEDGCFADLKVNTNDREDGTLWSEVVLFDKDGHQLAYTEPNYSGISGEWELEANGKTYIVSVGSR